MCLACLLLLRYLCIWIFIRKYLMVEDESWKVLVKILMVPAIKRKRCQNQTMANTCKIELNCCHTYCVSTLSLMMLRERIQMAFLLDWPPPRRPNLM